MNKVLFAGFDNLESTKVGVPELFMYDRDSKVITRSTDTVGKEWRVGPSFLLDGKDLGLCIA